MKIMLSSGFLGYKNGDSHMCNFSTDSEETCGLLIRIHIKIERKVIV